VKQTTVIPRAHKNLVGIFQNGMTDIRLEANVMLLIEI
jgi:hypothetical protein